MHHVIYYIIISSFRSSSLIFTSRFAVALWSAFPALLHDNFREMQFILQIHHWKPCPLNTEVFFRHSLRVKILSRTFSAQIWNWFLVYSVSKLKKFAALNLIFGVRSQFIGVSWKPKERLKCPMVHSHSSKKVIKFQSTGETAFEVS